MLNWLVNLFSGYTAVSQAEKETASKGTPAKVGRSAIVSMQKKNLNLPGIVGPMPAVSNTVVFDHGMGVVREPEDAGKPGANYSDSKTQYRTRAGIHKTSAHWGVR